MLSWKGLWILGILPVTCAVIDPSERTRELVQRAQTGDREALERIFARYFDRVRRAIGVRMGPVVRQWVESSDIMSQVFVKALEKFDSFEMRDDSSLLNWLTTIGCRYINDARRSAEADIRDIRRNVSIHSVSTRDSEADDWQLPDPAASISRELGTEEDRELVDNAMSRLEEDDREILLGFYFLDMSWDQIAADRGLPSREAARKRGDRARARLAIEIRRSRPREPES